MRPKLTLFLVLIAFAGFASVASQTQAQSEYDVLKRNFLSNHSVYLQERSNYETARAKYREFRTLTSQNTAILAAQRFLASSATLTQNYLEILNFHVRDSKHIPLEQKDLLHQLINDEHAFYQDIKNRASIAGDTISIMEISQEANERYKNQTLNKIQLTQYFLETERTRRIHNSATDISNNLSRISEDFAQTQRVLIDAWYAQTLGILAASQEDLREAEEVLNLHLAWYFDEELRQSRTRLPNLRTAENALNSSQNRLRIVSRNIREIIVRVEE